MRRHARATRRALVRRAAVSAAALAVLALAAAGWALTADLPGAGDLLTRSAPDATKIYDRHGVLLYEILDPRAGRRTRVRLEELPPHLVQAVIAVEDAGFYRHPGVDLRGVARAVVQMARQRRIVSGGSTITQQLSREVLLSQDERGERTVRRKLREMVLALRITRAYAKDQVLEMYLSEVYFGQLAYGIEAAARTYFGKPARELDLAEAALLAGLIQSPAAYNPLVDIDAARARQAVVLERMVATGVTSAEDARLARAERLRFAGGGGPLAAPHFVSWVQSRLEARYGPERVNTGGLHVVTTLDLDLQRRAEDIVRRRMAELNRREPGKPDYHATSAALVAIDPETGQVLALVGSADYFDRAIDGAVNVALALRQPGSAIKPLTYAAAFGASASGSTSASGMSRGSDPSPTTSRGPYPPLPFTPATVLSDVATSFPTRENEPYRPMNYDRMWHGPISLRRALATSSNLVAVKVLDAVGVDAMVDTAERLGITTFGDRERFGLALTLGGGDVRLVELTAAYGALANGGHRVTAEPILAVLDADAFRAAADGGGAGLAALAGGVRSVSGGTAISPQVAFLVNDILSDDQARLPAFGEGSVLALGRPAAAKTGTTTDFRDNWTVGHTPDLVTGVWVGNADNSPMRYISGITGAGPIWHDFMEAAHRGRPARPFARPDGLASVEVCVTSGLLPTPACRRRAREWFIAGTEPRATDTSFQAIALDATTGLRWAEGCAGRRAERVFRILPPDARDWGRQVGIPEPPMETCLGTPVFAGTPGLLLGGIAGGGPQALARGMTGGPTAIEAEVRGPANPPTALSMEAAAGIAQTILAVTQPAPNTTFTLTPQLPPAFQRIQVAATYAGEDRLREVSFYVNDQLVGTVRRPPYRVSWPLATGAHAARAVGTTEEGRRVESEPTPFRVLEDTESGASG